MHGAETTTTTQAATVPSIGKLVATVKKMIVEDGKLLIDAGIIAVGGYASIITRSPAAVILALVFALIFHLAI